MSIKSILKKSTFLRKSVERFRFYKKQFKNRGAAKIFVEKADEVISDFHRILSKSNLPYFLDAGTLLGIYRDGHLLKRDMDVDTGVIVSSPKDIDTVRELLTNAGFELKIEFSIPNRGIIQDAYDYKGVRVDVCYFLNEGDKTICHILFGHDDIMKLSVSKFNSIVEFDYNNQKIHIPENTDQYLTEKYGNWRQPDPLWKYWEGACVTKVEGKGVTKFI